MAEEKKLPSLTELSLEAHADLKMDPIGALKVAAKQHMISLKVSEIAMAVTSFPVLMSRATDAADWNISAINSFELGDNLFVEKESWAGTHLPIGMQTYPFFLMRSPADEKKFTIGIDESSTVFSKDEGIALFEDGKASPRLSQATAQLEHEVRNDVQTYQYAKKIEEFGLIREVDLQVHYHNGRINTLKGLNTINEKALSELAVEKLDELRKESYLPAIYSMLTSFYQFNNLIKLHNLKYPENTIAKVNFEAPKEEVAETAEA